MVRFTLRRVLIIALALCAAPGATPAGAAPRYRATIERDSSGIPHVTARDWDDLGYGDGYASAEDHLCRLANQFVTVSAERSRHFGPDAVFATEANEASSTNLESDFFYQRIRDARAVERLLARRVPHGPAREAKLPIRGWAAGYNAYLRSGRLRDPTCRGKPWVRPISSLDVWRRAYQLVLFASGGRFIAGTSSAMPPGPGASARSTRARIDGPALRRAVGTPSEPRTGSNVWAVGARGVRNGRRGVLLSNSHLPWRGTERLWEHHLRLPGRMNVWGASFLGVPVVNEGYTGHVAWAHTNDTTRRFTFFRLRLATDDPTVYVVDGRRRRMTRQTVRVKVRQRGRLHTRSHTFYSTPQGIVTDVPEATFGWTRENAYVLADSNADNLRAANTWLELGRARNLAGVRRALDRTQGTPWVNTLAVDRSGRALYADAGPVPNVDAATIARCQPAGAPALAYSVARVVTLDGSRSSCRWKRDRTALSPGTIGPRRLPRLVRPDWVANSNDSHWIVNPRAPLTGFSPLVGSERTPLSVRGRLGHLMVRDRVRGTDGLGRPGFDLGRAKTLMLNNRAHGAELVLDDLVGLCRANGLIALPGDRRVDVREACGVLAAYDGTGNLGARGGWLFGEWWRRTPGTAEGFWRDRFNPATPLTSPRRLRTANPQMLTALAEAVAGMRRARLALGASFGQVQHATKGRRRIPIHGCRSGCFNVIEADTTAPDLGEARFGSSAIFVIELTRRGARGATTSTHSQATDPTSPFFADGTERYSAKTWSPMRYTTREIRSDRLLRTRRLVGR